MRGNRMRESAQSEVNMTPMLDVVFIMLIFFIVTASFVKEAGVDVIRPPAQTAVAKDKGNILIAITENGQIWIDRRQVDPRSLRVNIERLHGENPQGAVVVQQVRGPTVGGDVDPLTVQRMAAVAPYQPSGDRVREQLLLGQEARSPGHRRSDEGGV